MKRDKRNRRGSRLVWFMVYCIKMERQGDASIFLMRREVEELLKFRIGVENYTILRTFVEKKVLRSKILDRSTDSLADMLQEIESWIKDSSDQDKLRGVTDTIEEGLMTVLDLIWIIDIEYVKICVDSIIGVKKTILKLFSIAALSYIEENVLEIKRCIHTFRNFYNISFFETLESSANMLGRIKVFELKNMKKSVFFHIFQSYVSLYLYFKYKFLGLKGKYCSILFLQCLIVFIEELFTVFLRLLFIILFCIVILVLLIIIFMCASYLVICIFRYFTYCLSIFILRIVVFFIAGLGFMLEEVIELIFYGIYFEYAGKHLSLVDDEYIYLCGPNDEQISAYTWLPKIRLHLLEISNFIGESALIEQAGMFTLMFFGVGIIAIYQSFDMFQEDVVTGRSQYAEYFNLFFRIYDLVYGYYLEYEPLLKKRK